MADIGSPKENASEQKSSLPAVPEVPRRARARQPHRPRRSAKPITFRTRTLRSSPIVRDVAEFHTMARRPLASAVDADVSGFDQCGGAGAGFHHPRMPQPFVETLALQLISSGARTLAGTRSHYSLRPLASCSFRAASFANGEFGSIARSRSRELALVAYWRSAGPLSRLSRPPLSRPPCSRSRSRPPSRPLRSRAPLSRAWNLSRPLPSKRSRRGPLASRASCGAVASVPVLTAGVSAGVSLRGLRKS